MPLKKKSQSGIITIVLILLLSLVAIVIVWNVVNGVLKRSSSQVNVDPFTIGLELKEAKFYSTGSIDVKVNRKPGEGNITSLKFIFNDKNGKIYNVNKPGNIKELETLPYLFSYTELNFTSPIEKISVVPVIGNKFGLEFQESDARKDEKGERIINNPDGIVSWWKFNGDMRDSAGINHGSCKSASGNCPILTSDRNGVSNSAYNFDGVNDYINITSSSSLNIPNNITISFWLKPNGWGEDECIINNKLFIIFHRGNWAGNKLYFLYEINSGYYGDSVWAPLAGVSSQIEFQINNWYYVTAVKRENSMEFWVNGTKIRQLDNLFSGYNVDTNLITDLCIGCPYAPGLSYFNGLIDDIIIFDRALSSEEIKGLYNLQKFNIY